ncbi:MAG TPA: hypothetical protein VMY37_01055 [Thermoguttaceae bacterium]|nr:hypothetical protein [Thermoguttaceae bacterium]
MQYVVYVLLGIWSVASLASGLAVPKVPFASGCRHRNLILKFAISTMAGFRIAACCALFVIPCAVGLAVAIGGAAMAEDAGAREYGYGLSREPVITVGALVIAFGVMAFGGAIALIATFHTGVAMRGWALAFAWRCERAKALINLLASNDLDVVFQAEAAEFVARKMQSPEGQHYLPLITSLRSIAHVNPRAAIWGAVVECLVSPPADKDISEIVERLSDKDSSPAEASVAGLELLLRFPETKFDEEWTAMFKHSCDYVTNQRRLGNRMKQRIKADKAARASLVRGLCSVLLNESSTFSTRERAFRLLVALREDPCRWVPITVILGYANRLPGNWLEALHALEKNGFPESASVSEALAETERKLAEWRSLLLSGSFDSLITELSAEPAAAYTGLAIVSGACGFKLKDRDAVASALLCTRERTLCDAAKEYAGNELLSESLFVVMILLPVVFMIFCGWNGSGRTATATMVSLACLALALVLLVVAGRIVLTPARRLRRDAKKPLAAASDRLRLGEGGNHASSPP